MSGVRRGAAVPLTALSLEAKSLVSLVYSASSRFFHDACMAQPALLRAALLKCAVGGESSSLSPRNCFSTIRRKPSIHGAGFHGTHLHHL